MSATSPPLVAIYHTCVPTEHLFGVDQKNVRKFQSSFYGGSELDNCDDKAFLIHRLWLLSGGGGVSGRHQKGVLTAHNWWSVEYETTASGTTQQYKRKM